MDPHLVRPFQRAADKNSVSRPVNEWFVGFGGGGGTILSARPTARPKQIRILGNPEIISLKTS